MPKEIRTEDFIYSEGIYEIKPLTLNMTITMKEGTVGGELRKTFTVKTDNFAFWKKFFLHSLSDKPVTIKAQIVFRNDLSSACKLRDYGIITEEELIKIRKIISNKK